MKLAEALKASKRREAIGHGHGATILASDVGILIVNKNKYDRKPWTDLLPSEQELISKLDWEPHEPKSPLQQLADSLTDWADDLSDN